MNRILLVDDDGFFASMFLNGFSWETAGFQSPVYAENGQSAIEILQQQSISLAFIDMSMPTMSGPELIGYISEHFPQVTCIALSNYDDFDFVKESFRAGAKDYLLKHCLNRNEMQRLLERYGDCSEAAHITVIPTADNPATEALTALLNGQDIFSADENLTHALGLPKLQNNLLLMRLQIENYTQFRQKYMQQGKLQYIIRNICSIMQNILDRHGAGVVFFNRQDEGFYSILTDTRFSSLPFLKHTRDLYGRQVCNSLKLYLNLDTRVYFAPLCGNVQDIAYAYEDILKQAHRNLPQRKAHLTAVDTELIFARSTRTVERYLQYPGFEPIRRYLAQQYETGRKLNYSLNQFLELTVTLYRVYLACRSKYLPDQSTNAASGIAELLDLKKVQDMEQHLASQLEALHRELRDQEEPLHSKHVKGALDIIHRQYSNSALCLNLVADMLHLNDSYLSRTFKTEMGIGISDYINQYRIQRAQDLLLIEHLTVKAVANRCGFENYTYFFRVFKRYTGTTPKEFCELHDLFSG